MFNLTGTEIVVILLLALVVLGPEKLPDAIRRFGRTYSELKKLSTGFQQEFRSALDEPMREMRDSADLLRRSADFSIDRTPDLQPTEDRAVASAPPSGSTSGTPAEPSAPEPTSELPFAREADSGVPSSGSSDTGQEDAGVPSSGSSDTGQEDSGVTEQRSGADGPGPA